jgi:hypothetical protein
VKEITLILALFCIVVYLAIRIALAKLFLQMLDSIATGFLGTILWTLIVDRKHTIEIKRITKEKNDAKKKLIECQEINKKLKKKDNKRR